MGMEQKAYSRHGSSGYEDLGWRPRTMQQWSDFWGSGMGPLRSVNWSRNLYGYGRRGWKSGNSIVYSEIYIVRVGVHIRRMASCSDIYITYIYIYSRLG